MRKQPFGLYPDRNPVGSQLGSIAGPVIVALVISLLAELTLRLTTLSDVILLFGINAIMVVGYQIFVGATGITSFGHAAFMGLGAYVGGVLSIPVSDKVTILPHLPKLLASLELNMLSSLLAAGIAAALLALVAGAALMRLSGSAASIATIGLLVIVTNLLAHTTHFTRGPQSLYGVPARTTFTWVFGSLVLAVLVSGLFKWSAFGLRAMSARDDSIAAESSGVSVVRTRLGAFVLSAFFTGIAGALYAQLLTAFSSSSFFLPQVVVVVSMAIIGGVNSISGALVGATGITVLNELMRRVENGFSIAGHVIQLPTGISIAVLGVALILFLRLKPAGVMGNNELQVVLGRRQEHSPDS